MQRVGKDKVIRWRMMEEEKTEKVQEGRGGEAEGGEDGQKRNNNRKKSDRGHSTR